MNMEKLTVDKKRLLILLSLADIVVTRNNNIYRRCLIDCHNCKFYDVGCYYLTDDINLEYQQMYREETILKWLKGE